ncbi:hypothetical protein QR680_009169 [Steinernema hermaphroditum]|uniref:Exocyst complex component 2 n=1 Tax=Steinernema hermaphroditum TaxID=289476 RepID=A0AA39IJC4_9BILA|nr:hypothetical protein QR680_009169 [Steinernema hermaphroditum]
MGKARGFYAVARGFKVGVYTTWDECKKQVSGFQNARYKKFPSIEEAQGFIEENTTLPSSSDSRLPPPPSASSSLYALRNNRKRTFPSAACSYGGGPSGPKLSRSISTSAAVGSGSSSTWKNATVVYTDGACSSNGKNNARAGYGVYWGDDHPDNVSEPLVGPATNNRAELQAVVKALEQGRDKGLDRLIVRTDSNLLIQSMEKWIKGWKKKGWVTANGQPVKNRDLLEKVDNLMSEVDVKFEHVRGHAGIHGNEMADRLAVAGAEKYDRFARFLMAPNGAPSDGHPIITGLSPKEGVPGQSVTIRGENLGIDQSDLVVLLICGTDCLMSAKWKSPTKIVARVGNAKRGLGEITICTRSGGRGISNVQFRVFPQTTGPLEESAVWVDEMRTVPGREVVRTIQETNDNVDALGINVDPKNRLDTTSLSRLFPDGSSNRRMESFDPRYYLLESHSHTKLEDLKKGVENMKQTALVEAESSKDVHKANLHSLISCVDALANFHDRLQLERNTRGWPLSKNLSEKVDDSSATADQLFLDVLNRKDRADATRNALSILTRFRFIFFLPSAIDENLAKGEYSAILNDYTRAKSLFKDTDVELFKEVMQVLDEKMIALKSLLKQRLIDVPTTFEDQSKLIKYLKCLDPESDPSWECITAYHCWLEDVLWQLQDKHHSLAVQDQAHRNEGMYQVEGISLHRQQFVGELISVLSDKLQTFWKLSQIYSSATDERYVQKQMDIDQMLINTINMSSWLMLNALAPSFLPEKDSIVNEYKIAGQFVTWPDISDRQQINELFASLKLLRVCVNSLLEFPNAALNHKHVQPLIELCNTLRLQCLDLLVRSTSTAIVALGAKENWKIDVVAGVSKTTLPYQYENELVESLPYFQQICSHDGFSGEFDLFSNESFKEMLISRFSLLIQSIKDCFEGLLKLKDNRRPQKLTLDDTSSTRSSTPSRGAPVGSNFDESDLGSAHNASSTAPSSNVTGRRLLISICNLECIIDHSLPMICKRLSGSGVRFADVILDKCKQKLVSYRSTIVRHYLAMKAATFTTLMDAVSYEDACEEDVSYFIKELIMCMVSIQSEMVVLAPQLSEQVMMSSVHTAVEKLLQALEGVPVRHEDQSTQIVVDITALEEALQAYMSLDNRRMLNALRAELMKRMDTERFQESMRSFRSSLRLAIESLKIPDSYTESSEI